MAAISSVSFSSTALDRSAAAASRTSRRSAPARRTVPSWSSPTAICWSCSASRSRRGPPPRSITPHIDLHCHSTASDGECEPQEVARRARAVDLAAIALTDHDTTDGVAEAAQEGARLGVRIIPGCEFSVRAPWGELHVLALFLPYAHEGLQTFLRDTRAARRRRGEQIVAKLQDLGVAIELEDVQAQLLGGDGGALGRPHVARALVDCGACGRSRRSSWEATAGRWAGRTRRIPALPGPRPGGVRREAAAQARRGHRARARRGWAHRGGAFGRSRHRGPTPQLSGPGTRLCRGPPPQSRARRRAAADALRRAAGTRHHGRVGLARRE